MTNMWLASTARAVIQSVVTGVWDGVRESQSQDQLAYAGSDDAHGKFQPGNGWATLGDVWELIVSLCCSDGLLPVELDCVPKKGVQGKNAFPF